MDKKTKLEVLLVEDNPADADLFQERFSDLGGLDVVVVHATCLAEALEAARSTRFDLIVLDLNLPDSSGLDTLHTFRCAHADGALIVLTGMQRDELSGVVRGEDVQDIIHKDESPGLLLARGLLYAVEKHHAQAGRQQLEKLVAFNPDAVLVVDGQGIVRFVNEAALSLFGRSREDFVGERLGFSIPEGEMTEIEVIRPDGRRTAAMHVVHFEWEGSPATLASIRDVTTTKVLNEQLRHAHKMEAIGRLAGGIAHDFNNLLTVILGYSNFMLGREVEKELFQSQLTEIVRAGDRAAALIRQLLLYSRSSESSPESVTLGAVLLDLESMLRRLIGEDIDLVVDPQSDLWPVVVDPMQIEQVIMNMAVNARDAMPLGGSLVVEAYNARVSAAQAAAWFDLDAGDYVVVSITDTGEGMSAETVSHIFEPFYTTKDIGKGTGLGLSTSYGIVKTAGGHIEVSSDPGKGSTFRIYLPRGEKDPVHQEPKGVALEHLSGKETVLVVEDNEAVRKLTCESLAAQGYTVLTADGGPEAVQIAGEYEGRIDLLLTDVIMPRMSGPQVAVIVQRLHPQMHLLFMTGYTGHASHQVVQLPQGAECLNKPFTPVVLAKRVREILDQGMPVS